MHSEKVKEIKKALECCANVKEKCDNKKCYLFDKLEYPYCERQLKKDLLTLINDLESENERLEKEKKEHGKKKFLRGWKLGIEEFAEMLKEKFEHCVGDTYDADTIDERTDETLKEVLNNEKQETTNN